MPKRKPKRGRSSPPKRVAAVARNGTGARSEKTAIGTRSDEPAGAGAGRERRWLLPLLPLLLLVVAISAGYLWNEDFWWYLSSGQAILDAGGIPDEDPFLYTSEDGLGWVYHSWLWTVLVGGLERVGGLGAVVLLHVLVALALIVLVYTAARPDPLGLANLLVTLLFLVTIRHRLAGKAEIATWLLFVVFVLILERKREFDWKQGLALVVLQVLWANLHGGYPLGIFVVACFAAGSFVERRFLGRQDAAGPPLWLPVVLFLAAVADPRMWRERLSPFGFVTGSGAVQPASESGTMLILEWRSPFQIAADHPSWLLLLLLSAAVGLGSFRGAKPLSVSRLFLFLGMTLFGATAVRQVSGAALTAAVVTLHNLADRARSPSVTRARVALAVAACLLAVVSAFSLWIARPGFQAGQATDVAVVRPSISAPGAVSYLRSRTFSGPLFNDYPLGAYLGHALAGREKVFVDSRVLDADVVVDYTEIVQSRQRWQEAERRYGFRIAVLGHFSKTIRSPLGAALISDPSWGLAFVDPHAAVFVKDHQASPVLDGLSSAPFLEPTLLAAPLVALERVFLGEDPSNYLVELLGNLGALGLAQEVVALADQALARRPGDGRFLYRRCAALIHVGRIAEALEDCAAASDELDDDNQVTATYAVALERAGRRDDALRLIERALRRTPEDRQLRQVREQLTSSPR